MKKMTKVFAALFSAALALAFSSCSSLMSAGGTAKTGFSARSEVLDYADDPLYWDIELVSEKDSPSKVYKINKGEFYGIFPPASYVKSNLSGEDLGQALIVKAADNAKIIACLKKIDTGYSNATGVYYDFQLFDKSRWNTDKGVTITETTNNEKEEAPQKKGGLFSSLFSFGGGSTSGSTSSYSTNITTASMRAQVKNVDSKKKSIIYSVKGAEKEISVKELESLISSLQK